MIPKPIKIALALIGSIPITIILFHVMKFLYFGFYENRLGDSFQKIIDALL